MYKASQFNLIYPYEDNTYLVYNTLTQALLEINQLVHDFLVAKDNSELPQDYMDTLSQNGIILPDTENETIKANTWIWQSKSRSNQIIGTILTTLRCNLACTYCYEEKIKDKGDLSDDNAARIAYWLIDHAQQKKSDHIKVVFYGGEPLLNTAPIKIVSDILNKWAAEGNRHYDFSLISNGTLFTPAMCDWLIPMGFNGIKITVDGDRDTHNRFRPYKNGRATFDHVFDHILETVDKTKVILSGNITTDNVAGIYRLIDDLYQKGLHKRLHRVDFSPIVPGLSSTCKMDHSHDCLGTDAKMLKEFIYLRFALINMGFKTNFTVASNRCSLCSDDTEMAFDPAGNIYKCNLLVGHPQYAVGHIATHQFNTFHREMMAFSPWQMEKCNTCPFLPACNGACRYKAFVEKGDFTEVNCMQEFLFTSYPSWIKLEYKKLVEA